MCGCWWRVLAGDGVCLTQMDLGSMSVNNLRSIITERGFSTLGLLTRDELVDRAQEAMAAPSLPPLDDGEASADSEEELVEGKTRRAERLVMQELRHILKLSRSNPEGTPPAIRRGRRTVAQAMRPCHAV